MNERIKELAGQCEGRTICECGEAGFNYEKFAELIVRECMEVVKWTPSIFPNDEYVKNIKEHFGVEE